MKHTLAFVLALAVVLAIPIPAAAQTRPASILADPWFQEQARVGLNYLYDMDFGAADSIFSEITARYPDHPVGPYLQALLPWWAIQIEPDDPSQDPAVFEAMENVLDVCDRRLRKNPGDLDALFFKAGAHALRGRLHADRRNWLRAARDGQQALKTLQEVRKRDPNNDDLYFGIGLFDYLADEVPKQYRVLRPFARLFPKGDKDRGITELERAMRKGQFVSAEAAYSLLQIHYIFEKDYQASLRYAQWLRARHPDNSIFQLYEGRIYERLGRFGEAERVFQNVLARHSQGQSGYTDAMAEQALYLLARTTMWQGRPAEALGYINQLERLTAQRPVESEYKALGKLRKGMAFDALGKRQDAVRCYRDVLAMKGYDGDGDIRSRAKGYLKKPFRS
ncbi:MAG TPA: tetratricopeptide repeat protein [Thermoanaerobaculia bacterium]|jgi:tetratricopeptide (TPR) repeat protein|nr:tetratricopeptide repeat protein [Thermoanaerobaculia bacterium]